ncbi:TetR-like C-terminal domain-containing protein [Amycolatopsis halotolerans]|uniref:TetR-like C-terminal domain-containing protein n=1 Tax=Amycolatopsis halotolerans TaxID=330083 RepID=A0ABV7QQ28_9PSEU
MTRPGGRSARVREAVHRAVIELLAEGETTAGVPQIAERAGVNPTSVYRRWGSCASVLLDAAVARLSLTSPVPDTGSLRGDVEQWATAVERALADPDGAVLVRALITFIGTNADPIEHLLSRGEDLEQMLTAAAARGEPALDLQELLDYVLAPLYLRVLLSRPIEPGIGLRLADRLLTAAGLPPASGQGG